MRRTPCSGITIEYLDLFYAIGYFQKINGGNSRQQVRHGFAVSASMQETAATEQCEPVFMIITKGGTMRFRHVFFLSFLSIFLLQGCAANKYDMIHYCLKEEPRIKPPQKFLLLPIDVSIVEITAGGNIEEVPSLTEQSRTYLYENITELLKSRPGLELVGLPDLPDEQKAVMDQHTALFDRVLDCRSYYLYISAFHHKLERPDSTIGEGLAFLGENTGADAAIIVSGGGFVSTTGRKVMSLLLTGAPMSGSGLDIGVIDLKTGNVLWTNSLLLQHMNLTNENTVKLIVKSLLSKFPDFQHIEVKKDA